MSKGSHEVTKSVKTRLCEWRGLNQIAFPIANMWKILYTDI